MLDWLPSWVSGRKDPARVPFDVFITYETGTTSKLHVWARDGREALSLASYWLVELEPVTKVTVARRKVAS